MSIPFTQYLRPDGRRQQINIDRPAEIEELARRLIVCGYRFEIEVLTTGEVSMEVVRDIPDPDCTDSLGLELCINGPAVEGVPGVPETVDKLITNAAQVLVNTVDGCSPPPSPPEPEEDCSPPFGE